MKNAWERLLNASGEAIDILRGMTEACDTRDARMGGLDVEQAREVTQNLLRARQEIIDSGITLDAVPELLRAVKVTLRNCTCEESGCDKCGTLVQALDAVTR